ncbi:MAG: hypothetical protein MMC33_010603 [Icmadophila ericetorum]|nr:hypothetical protein [Icmadophila ericetorum]
MQHAHSQVSNSETPIRPRLNVLVLDGGGVRGLSSLIILERFMMLVNKNVPEETAGRPLHPQDIFGLAAGTSTGGLIALMLGKLNMSVEDCIQAYKELSKIIFGKSSFRGRLSKGFWRERYSGEQICECVRVLLKEHKGETNTDLQMVSDGDKMLCAVVCREHLDGSDLSAYDKNPVSICNRDCGGKSILCPVYHAAQATSAAPTYFPIVEIFDSVQGKNRYFADGGFLYNNPSKFIWTHYGEVARASTAAPSKEIPQTAVHEGLDHTYVRYINLGTGKFTNELARKRDKVAGAWPNVLKLRSIRRMVHLLGMLKKAATDADTAAEAMETIARVNDNLKYERYSADNGVCLIKLDKYRQLKEIEDLTKAYLDKLEVRMSMETVAKEIAQEYLARKKADKTRPKELGSIENGPAERLVGAVPGLWSGLETQHAQSSRSESPNTRTSDDRGNTGLSPTSSTASSLRNSDSKATNSASHPSAANPSIPELPIRTRGDTPAQVVAANA